MLDFTNISDHPTRKTIQVYRFYNKAQESYFENLLKENDIEYEKQIDESEKYTAYFGVHKADVKKVNQLNYIALGKFRQPFIPDKTVRIILIIVSMFILGLAIAGYLLDKNK